MNERLAGLLGATIPSADWVGGFSPVNPDVFEPTFSSPNDIAVATDTIFSAQQDRETGTASFRSPVETPQSVGGDATRPGDGTVTAGGQTNSEYASGEWFDNPKASTAFQVKNFLDGTVSGMKAISSVFNGYIQSAQYNMQATSMDYMARQNQRNADLMRRNIREINRAAQNDVNVISMQATQRKSEQRIAQAASGFKVGAGVYNVLNDNTDFKTNYNASLIMLRAGLQGAEIVRSAGAMEAQSIINKADADIARMNAETAKLNGWVSAAANALSSGASFYIGRYGVQ